MTTGYFLRKLESIKQRKTTGRPYTQFLDSNEIYTGPPSDPALSNNKRIVIIGAYVTKLGVDIH